MHNASCNYIDEKGREEYMSDMMNAVVYKTEGVVEFERRPIPILREPDDVLLKILIASVCGSDLGITAVPQRHSATEDSILGHEFIGEIVAFGDNHGDFCVGDRVVVNPMYACGSCEACKLGHINMCEQAACVGENCDGGFAEYCVVKTNMLFHISKNLNLEDAVMTEPLACVLNGFNRLNFLPGKSVLIYGAGPIGIMFSKLMREAGAGAIVISEISQQRIEHAQKFSQADCVINPSVEAATDVLHRLTGRQGADVVIDAVGSLFASAVSDAAFEGTVLLFGVNNQATQTVHQFDITRKELKIVASFATEHTFIHAIHILESHVLNLEGIATKRVTLDELPSAIEMQRRGETTKVVVYPNGL